MIDEQIEKAITEIANEKAFDFITYQDKTIKHWLLIFENYIQRLKDDNEKLLSAQVNRLKLLEMQMKNGEIDMTFGSEDCNAFVYSILQMFKQNGGTNFVSTTIEVDGKELGGRYALTIQKVGGLTPIEKARKDTAREIIDMVLHCPNSMNELLSRVANEYGVEIEE